MTTLGDLEGQNVTDWDVCNYNGSRCVKFEYHDTFTSIVGEVRIEVLNEFIGLHIKSV